MLMKNFILTACSQSAFNEGVSAQNYYNREEINEIEIETLEEDVQVTFFYTVNVKISTQKDDEKGIWIIKLEDIMPKDYVADIYYLKLDEGCVPGPKLENLVINGHELNIMLARKAPELKNKNEK